MRIAAIDQGTTSTRILLADTNGASEIVRALRHEQHHPQAGFLEHDAEELIRNIRACLEAVEPVDVIGIDNQGEAAWRGTPRLARLFRQ